MEKVKENKGIRKLRIDTLANCFKFIEEKEIFNSIVKVSKFFTKALKRDHFWQDLVLRKELFVQKDEVISWRKYYSKLITLTKSFKEGRPNKSFKMFPCRNHKVPITALTNFTVSIYKNEDTEEIKVSDDWIISGDSSGLVLQWIYDKEENEYISKEIITIKSSNESLSNEIRFIKRVSIKTYNNKDYNNSVESDILIIISKSGTILIFSIEENQLNINSMELENQLFNTHTKLVLLKEITSSIKVINQIEIKQNLLFVGYNLNEINYMQADCLVESFDLSNGESFFKFTPTYPLEFTKKLREVIEKRKNLPGKENQLVFAGHSDKEIFDLNRTKKSFALVNNKLVLFSNFDLIENYPAIVFEDPLVPNLFIFNSENKYIGAQTMHRVGNNAIAEIYSKSDAEDIFFVIEKTGSNLLMKLLNINKPENSLQIINLGNCWDFQNINYLISRFGKNSFIYSFEKKNYLLKIGIDNASELRMINSNDKENLGNIYTLVEDQIKVNILFRLLLQMTKI